MLAGAYFISVTYYLQLLAWFLLNAAGLKNQFAAHCITTGLLLVIGGIGIWRGLGMLERLEKYAVALNLGMIAALLAETCPTKAIRVENVETKERLFPY